MDHRGLIFHEDSVRAVIWKMFLTVTESNWKVNRGTCGKRPVCYQNFFLMVGGKLWERGGAQCHTPPRLLIGLLMEGMSQRIREMEALRARAKCFIFWQVDVCIIYD